ncbi:uncharacterized protein LOC142979904 [Anticarsia gemmatalis]|uniref:uncharacterized protein LOC142979904 n=1 Tax=Anticarsia gemmatalis TaxID=129554 RepID=UPI003F7665D1
MGIEVAVKVMRKIGNLLSLEIAVEITRYEEPSTVLTEEYLINDVTLFQVMVMRESNGIIYLIKFLKKCKTDELTYSLEYRHKVESKPDESISKTFNTDDDSWRLIQIYNDGAINKKINIFLKVSVTMYRNPCANLYEDTELTDFELRGEDGSVQVHKAVVAACSPVFKTMFAGQWRETTEGVIEVPGTCTDVLQHFKRYIYQGTVPQDYLGALLLLASYFMMPDLERRCQFELMAHLTSDNAYETIQFAVKHNKPQLLFDVLERVQKNEISVTKMRKQEASIKEKKEVS